MTKNKGLFRRVIQRGFQGTNPVYLHFEDTSGYVAKTSAHFRVIWLAILLTSIFLLIVQVKKKFAQFGDMPVLTDIEVDYQEELSFPAVAFCNTNQYR